MRKITSVILFIVFFSQNSSAQFTRYIVKFKDKTGTPYSVNDPSKFLSARAIARRAKQHIAIDETDFPVTPAYIDSVRLSGDVQILDKSKWMNQVCIATTDSSAIDKINRFPFVVTTQPLKRTASPTLTLRNKSDDSITKNKFNERSSNINSPQSPRHVSG
ncbi:MAG: hypothetical protein ABI184_02515, partial [Ginsengibacter sp.]